MTATPKYRVLVKADTPAGLQAGLAEALARGVFLAHSGADSATATPEWSYDLRAVRARKPRKPSVGGKPLPKGSAA